MKTSFLLLFLFNTGLLVCQTRYVRIIDFDNTPQTVEQIVEYGGYYYLSYTQSCQDAVGNWTDICGGVLKIDEYGHIIDSNRIKSFSDNQNSIVINSKEKKIYLAGEPYTADYVHKFQVNEFPINNLTSVAKTFYKFPSEDQINYFQKGSILNNDNLIIVGSSRSIENNDIRTILFDIKEGIPDTSFILDLGLGTLTWELYADKDGLITLHVVIMNTGQSDRSAIIKYDKSYKVKWQWTAENPNGLQLPYGCELKDGRIIMAMHTPGYSNTGSVWCINPDSTISWKFEFPEKSGMISRKFFRLKQLKNGDIVGVGHYGNRKLNLEKEISRVPFIFRISKEGQFLWEKAFYNVPPVIDYSIGVFLDVEEIENGDLLCVGSIRNYLVNDPVTNGERVDDDILIIRTDADGCVDDRCDTVTRIDTLASTAYSPPGTQDVLLYPNPSDGTMYLGGDEPVASMEVYDLQGKRIVSLTDPGSKVDLTFLRGLYVARLYLKNGRVSHRKIVINH